MQLQIRASSEAGTLPTIVNPIPDAHPCREGEGSTIMVHGSGAVVSRHQVAAPQLERAHRREDV